MTHRLSQDASGHVVADDAAASPLTAKPIVVGLYGLPGAGKSSLLASLEAELGEEHFAFFEGAEVISELVAGGLPAFKSMDPDERHRWRGRAVAFIGSECARTGRVGVVTGHFSFPDGTGGDPDVVFTKSDASTYTHIFYLRVPAETVLLRRLRDTARSRPSLSERDISEWQSFERRRMRSLCLDGRILYSDLSPTPSLLGNALTRLRDVRRHSEEVNLARALSHLDRVLLGMGSRGKLDSMLVFDADKTLCDGDTGSRFWELQMRGSPESDRLGCPLKTLFASPMGYSHEAFRQAVLYYEDLADGDFDRLCDRVASEVTIHPELVALLRAAQQQEDETNAGAVVVTCGIRRVWEMALARQGLADVKVIGGGRVSDGYVVGPEVKAAVVSRLRNHHGLRVCAFGDSPMDLPMLKLADEAVVVVGDAKTRSRSMDAALADAIDQDGLRARQLLLPPATSTPRLSGDKLPVLSSDVPTLVGCIARAGPPPPPPPRLRVLDATSKNAAKLLATPTRDTAVRGPRLREAHGRVGWYLATELLPDVVGVEEHPVLHVQGHATAGYRIRDEERTTIVALMRGGEPMALGVSEAMPRAVFLHARRPEDVTGGHVRGKKTVVLVDSVINSGESVKQFVERVRALDCAVRIVVVAGVVQERSIENVMRPLSGAADLSVVALRRSANQFTGRGGTDTGNRLFNTTDLD